MDIYRFWSAVLGQDAAAIRAFFHPDAYVNWHCTNEHFTAEEFIRANCEYPGEWEGEVERVIHAEDAVITVVHVYLRDRSLSFHVTSFIRVRGERIEAMDEYWADDGTPPAWRRELGIGIPIS